MGKKLRVAGGKLGYIPEDVIAEILKELPLRYLLRCRSVCNGWRSIIDDPSFVDTHRRRSYDRPGGVKLLVEQEKGIGDKKRWQAFVLVDVVAEEEEGCEDDRVTPVPHPMPGYRVISGPTVEGVEGLICIHNTIWNPGTRKVFVLPPQCTNNSEFENRRGPNNVFYLGFDSRTKQYKVLSICCSAAAGPKVKYLVQIFTLGADGTNSWRDITHCLQEDDIRGMELTKNNSIYVKDKIYVLVKYPGLEYSGLMVFSVGDEKLRFLRLPDCIDADSWCLTEARGRVALMEKGRNTAQMWIVVDYDTEKWEWEWEKVIGHQTWPAYAVTPVAKTMSIVCDMGNNEILMQAKVKVSDGAAAHSVKLVCHYLDLKNIKFREGPNLEGSRANQIFSKQVETLFDPTPHHTNNYASLVN